jgi:hypothetical protein
MPDSGEFFSADQLAEILPYLELASVIDDVFSCDDAMDPTKRIMGFGRCYRGWANWRKQVDTTFDERRRIRR